MKKVAIVGVEGSGKTVLMAAMGDKYKLPDVNGIFLKPENRETYAYYTRETAKLRSGKWPLVTSVEKVLNLDWALSRRGKNDLVPQEICRLSFLDYGGEVYRLAFGGGQTTERHEIFKESIASLRSHVLEADVLVVLVNMSDIINGSDEDERTIETKWLSQAILSFACENGAKKNIALVFSQADLYAETITANGGLNKVLSIYMPEVYAWYSNRISLFAVSAVNKTVPAADGSGYLVPAADFDSDGFGELMLWMSDIGESRHIGERGKLSDDSNVISQQNAANYAQTTHVEHKVGLGVRFWGRVKGGFGSFCDYWRYFDLDDAKIILKNTLIYVCPLIMGIFWATHPKEVRAFYDTLKNKLTFFDKVQVPVLARDTTVRSSSTSHMTSSTITRECPICHGKGEVACKECGGDPRCKECKGKGRIRKEKDERCPNCRYETGVMEGYKRCRYCIKGKILDSYSPIGYRLCRECGGIGEVECRACKGYGTITKSAQEKCGKCGGSGHGCSVCLDGTITCPTCKGKGMVCN